MACRIARPLLLWPLAFRARIFGRKPVKEVTFEGVKVALEDDEEISCSNRKGPCGQKWIVKERAREMSA